MDTIFVRSLTIDAILGVHPHEREKPQPVRISFAMATDASRAAREDDIGEAVDYAAAARRVAALTVEGRFQLVETLAEHIAALLLHEFPIQRVRVEVEKPDALAEAESVGVTIERRKRVG